jgi:superfamily II DNA/RNA helicase
LAFALPIVEALKNKPRTRNPSVLVLEPTRELAKQTAEEFEKIAPNMIVTTVYGGVGYQTQGSVFWKFDQRL